MSGFELIAAASAAIGAAGTVAGGIAANNQAQFQAEQQKAQGKEDFAASQRDAAQQRKEAELVMSRQQALAAASGGSATDPTIIQLMTETASQGELNAQGSLFGGEQRKRGAFDQAKATRLSGQSSLIGSFLGGTGDLLGGFAKYKQNKSTYG